MYLKELKEESKKTKETWENDCAKIRHDILQQKIAKK